jgi:hypothetical protein
MGIFTYHVMIKRVISILHMKVTKLELLTAVVNVIFLGRVGSSCCSCLLSLLVIEDAMLFLCSSFNSLDIVLNYLFFFHLNHPHRLLSLTQLILEHYLFHLFNFNINDIIIVSVTNS